MDDEPDALQLLQSWTERHGLQVRTAPSSESALSLCHSFRPDVLITDYLLQGESTGVDLIVQLRAAGLRMRCVLVTGVLQSALLESVHRIHGVPILTKPFDYNRLHKLIAS